MTLTVADRLAQRLAQAGCRWAFGVPGGEVLTLIDALERAGIRFIVARHEAAAGFMAEGTWHATGAPGILVATIGPGLANTVNPVANAQQDRTPLIVISGCVDPAAAQSYTHQVFDHRAVLAPLVKASFLVSVGAGAAIAEKAVAAAISMPPGAVHLDLPVSVAAAMEPDLPIARRALPAPSRPTRRALSAVREVLASAKRPLIIAGLEAVAPTSAKAVSDLTLASGAPLITTYKAKGVLDETHPQCLGAAGLSPKADALLLPIVRQADVVLAIGYDPIEMRAGWCHPFSDNQTIIEIAGWAASHGMHRADHLLIGDIAEIIEDLADALPPTDFWADSARKALQKAFAPSAEWGPSAIIATARRILPPNTLATVDSGAHRILLSQMWHCPTPEGLLQSSGLCTMACALPLAIGAALAAPTKGRPVVAFVGDGGLEMGLGELATLRDLGLPVIIIVFVDGAYALIEMKQRAMQLPNAGVDLGITDFAAIATAFGGIGVTVTSTALLESALRAALQTEDRFTLIACPIDRRSYDGLL